MPRDGSGDDLAEKDLAEAYLLKPRDVTVLSLLGVLYFKQGRLERAEEVFGKLAASSPNDAAILFNLGLINFKLNRFRDRDQRRIDRVLRALSSEARSFLSIPALLTAIGSCSFSCRREYRHFYRAREIRR